VHCSRKRPASLDADTVGRDERGEVVPWTTIEKRGRGGPVDVRSVGGGRRVKGGSGSVVFFVVLRWPDGDVFYFRMSDAF
jgi:hypothetical protein